MLSLFLYFVIWAVWAIAFDLVRSKAQGGLYTARQRVQNAVITVLIMAATLGVILVFAP